MAREKITMRVGITSRNGFPVIKTYGSKEQVSGFVLELEGYDISEIADQILDYVYESHYSFREGFAGVCRGRLWGFINLGLTEVVEPKYEYVGSVSEGFVTVKKEGKYGYLKMREQAYPSKWTDIQYDGANSFCNGRARVKKDELYGYIGDSYDSKEVIPIIFEEAYDFDHTYPYAVVKENGKYGVIDKSGDWIVDPIFDEYYTSSQREGSSYYNAVIDDRLYYLYPNGHYEEVE
jgi:hypothetical protein